MSSLKFWRTKKYRKVGREKELRLRTLVKGLLDGYGFKNKVRHENHLGFVPVFQGSYLRGSFVVFTKYPQLCHLKIRVARGNNLLNTRSNHFRKDKEFGGRVVGVREVGTSSVSVHPTLLPSFVPS